MNCDQWYHDSIQAIVHALYGSQAPFAVQVELGNQKYRFPIWQDEQLPDQLIAYDTETAKIQANEILRMRDVLNEILADHSGRNIEDIARDTDRDFFLSAAQAKEYGLVDDILAKPPAAEDEMGEA